MPSASENAGRTMMEADRLRAEVESLREQLEATRTTRNVLEDVLGDVKREKQAAEAKLAEVEKERDVAMRALRRINGGGSAQWSKAQAAEAINEIARTLSEDEPTTKGDT